LAIKLTNMQKYILRRLLYSIITIIVIVFMVFTISRLAGDPVEAYVTPETPARRDMVNNMKTMTMIVMIE